MTNNMAKVTKNGLMELNTKETLRMALKKAKVFLISQMEAFMKVNSAKMRSMALETITG